MTISKSGLPQRPVIAVPTITLEGDANGAPHPDPSAYAKKFSGKYAHRPSRAASATTCPRKPRRPSPKPSSTLPESDRQEPPQQHLASFETAAGAASSG